MDWRRHPRDDALDPEGVGDFLDRLGGLVGEPAPAGIQFLHDARQMLETSREIEASAAGTGDELLVGFQTAEKLEREAETYRSLTRGGTRVTAFGEGEPRVAIPGLAWVPLPEDPHALANQWFLVAREPSPVAFVGFDTSAPERRGIGPAGAATRTWEGFWTEDPRVVDALRDHLGGVALDRLAPA